MIPNSVDCKYDWDALLTDNSILGSGINILDINLIPNSST